MIKLSFFDSCRNQLHFMQTIVELEPLLNDLLRHHMNQTRAIGTTSEMREFHRSVVDKLQKLLEVRNR